MANNFKPAQIRRIVTFVTANPEASRQDIAKGLKFNRAEVGKALADLKAEGVLVSTGAKRGTRWNLATLRDKLVMAINASGRQGVSRSDLMATLNLDKSMGIHVTYLLTTLAENGAVVKGGAKRGTRYFPQWN